MRRCLWVSVVALVCAACCAAGRGDEEQGENPKPRRRNALVRALAPLFRAAAEPTINEEAVQQLMLQYQNLVAGELEILRQACELPPEQRPKIKAAAQASLKETVLHEAKAQGNPEADPGGSKVRANLRNALGKLLTPEQAAGYARRLAQRDARRKRAAIQLAVVRLDAVLHLTPEQRDKISDNLSKSWQEPWSGWLSLSDVEGGYVPEVPDDSVVPHLRAEQVTVYRGIEKISFSAEDVTIDGPLDAEAAEDADWWCGKPADAVQASPGQ